MLYKLIGPPVDMWSLVNSVLTVNGAPFMGCPPGTVVLNHVEHVPGRTTVNFGTVASSLFGMYEQAEWPWRHGQKFRLLTPLPRLLTSKPSGCPELN